MDTPIDQRRVTSTLRFRQVGDVRAALKVATLAAREADPSPRTFTLEELIAQPLPDVSHYPIYTWAGPKTVPPKPATSLD